MLGIYAIGSGFVIVTAASTCRSARWSAHRRDHRKIISQRRRPRLSLGLGSEWRSGGAGRAGAGAASRLKLQPSSSHWADAAHPRISQTIVRAARSAWAVAAAATGNEGRSRSPAISLCPTPRDLSACRAGPYLLHFTVFVATSTPSAVPRRGPVPAQRRGSRPRLRDLVGLPRGGVATPIHRPESQQVGVAYSCTPSRRWCWAGALARRRGDRLGIIIGSAMMRVIDNGSTCSGPLQDPTGPAPVATKPNWTSHRGAVICSPSCSIGRPHRAAERRLRHSAGAAAPSPTAGARVSPRISAAPHDAARPAERAPPASLAPEHPFLRRIRSQRAFSASSALEST